MKKMIRIAAATVLSVAAEVSNAQGIPVIDVANLVQSIQEVIDALTQIDNQVQQIGQLRDQLNAVTGSRGLGSILNNPLLKNYVPANAYQAFESVGRGGYGGLTATAKALRDAGMVYNCEDRSGSDRTDCQAQLAQPYQQKGLIQDAMAAASGRLAQINALMAAVDSTTDQKAVLELQARIGAENAQLAHESTQIQLLQGLADSEERIRRSKDRERQLEMLGRTGRLSDFLR